MTKNNKTKTLCLLMAACLAVGMTAACTAEKQNVVATVTGAEEGVVNAVYNGAPVAVTTTSEQSVEFTVKYAGIDGTVYTESETAPTNAGKYSVTISFAGDSKYNEYTATVSLIIAKAENHFTVSMPNYTYGQTGVVPTVSGNSGGAVSYVYEGTGTTAYEASAQQPGVVGSYKVTATAAETENYLSATAEAAFSVEKAAGSLVISMDDYTVSQTDVSPVVKTNLSGGEVTYLYEGTGDTVYAASSVKPTAAGTYIVTATAAATENYEAATANAAFKVIMPQRTDVPETAPVLDTNTMVMDDGFAIVAEEDTEYRLTDASGAGVSEWQSTGIFSGLEGKTTYYVEARRPATQTASASVPGAEKLEVTTLEGALADDFERKSNGDGVGNFTASNEKAHGGDMSIKSSTPDGAYGFILQPNSLLERDDNGTKYNGYWQNGNYDENHIDISGYRYISFWAYFEKDVAIGQGIEIWKTDGGDVFNCGVGQTIKGGSWQRVVIDMTINGVCRGDFDDICSHVGKIYFNFAYTPASEIGTFYIDDFMFLK